MMTIITHLKRLSVLAVLLAATLLPAQQSDKPRSSGSIHYNYSRRIRYYSWASVDYKVTNPTNKPLEVVMRFSPLGQRNVTVYENKFMVGPGLRYQFHMPVTIGTVDKYAVDMFLDGHRVTNVNSRETVIRLAQPENRYVVFVNDYDDMSFGMFSKNEGLDGSYVNTLNKTLKAATHFAGYDNAHVVVLMRPDFNRMNSRQFNAILDHVSRGGTLIFGDPHGAMEAWTTPLRKCLPVTPLRIRPLEKLTALVDIGGTEVFWPDGRPFLESVPRGDGVTTLTHEDFPLLRWGRYGLGKVGVCALNPSLQDLQKDNRRNFNAYWRHLLSFGGRVSYASSTRDPGLTQAVDKLTGIKIPKGGAIRIMIFCYVGAILICVILGFVLKQHVRSWIALAAISLISTWAVFMYARFRQRKLAPRTATVLEFTNHGTEDKSTEQLVSLTLKQDQTLDMMNPNVDLLLRSFPPPVRERKKRKRKKSSQEGSRPGAKPGEKTAKAGSGGKPKPGKGMKNNDMFGKSKKGEDEELRDPLKIDQKNGRGSLENLLLQDGKPMFFGSLVTNSGTELTDFPVVKWLPDGPRVEAWEFPEGIKPDYAVLVCENGCYPMTIKGKSVLLKGGSRKGAMDLVGPEYISLSDFMSRVLTPAPLIVLFAPISKDSTGFINPPDVDPKKAFDVVGRALHMTPVIEDLTSDEITIPGERVRLEPANSAARVLKTSGKYTELTPAKNTYTGYTLNCFLPPAHSKIDALEVVVDFVPENRGQNIEFKFGVRGETQPKGNEFTMKLRADGKYVIKLTPEQWKQMIDRSSGQFQLVLSCKPKRILKDQLARIRQNTWKVKRLNVSVRGTLPPEHRGRL